MDSQGSENLKELFEKFRKTSQADLPRKISSEWFAMEKKELMQR